MKYKKKPVEIESFIEGHNIKLDNDIQQEKFEDYERLVIDKGRKITTLEGTMIADIGDYIIKGVNGEFYPCKPDIFKKTYEKVE